MIIRRWSSRWRKPAPGQLTFRFVVVWTPLEIEPPTPPPCRRSGGAGAGRPLESRQSDRPTETVEPSTAGSDAARRAACAGAGRLPTTIT
jgi:hypothetical protein